MIERDENAATEFTSEYRWRTFTGTTIFDGSLRECANAIGLDPNDVAWAIAEFGRCDVETIVAWKPSDDDGWEWPTNEAPAQYGFED